MEHKIRNKKMNKLSRMLIRKIKMLSGFIGVALVRISALVFLTMVTIDFVLKIANNLK